MRIPPPIVLCTSSKARQALCLSTRPIITLFPQKNLTYAERSWDVTSSTIPHPQHIENTDIKWKVVRPHLQVWKRFDTPLWHRFLGLVCDTMVYAGGKAHGKPHSKAEAKQWLTSYFDKPPTVVTCCQGGLIDNGELVQTFNYVCQTPLRFITASRSELLTYAQTHFAEITHRAGAIHIEAYLASGWVEPPDDLENVIGLPIAQLRAYLRKEGLL